MSIRTRHERIEFRTTSAVRELVERAARESGGSLTEFAEASLTLAAQRVLADRNRFTLSNEALSAWEKINARPARELPGVRRLMERSSPFAE
ncbi:MAG: DUF1778 domain-containing protein [Gammaproteobacteria bacterium HGW-Gammaproteobacteria-8]|nr:MAG: DUF1778 domain-containing protein [Gammaproteobacteria bacterium HGW-Gammaproteobacteria-8]